MTVPAKVTITLPGGDEKAITEALLKGLHYTKEASAPGSLVVSFEGASEDYFEFYQRFKQAEKGFLYDMDDTVANGNEAYFSEEGKKRAVDALNQPKSFKEYVERGPDFHGIATVRQGSTFLNSVNSRVAFSPDQDFRASLRKTAERIATEIHFWDADGNPDTMEDFYYLKKDDFEKLSKAIPPAADVLRYGLQAVYDDALRQPDDYIFYPVLVSPQTGKPEIFKPTIPDLDIRQTLPNLGELKKYPHGYKRPTIAQLNQLLSQTGLMVEEAALAKYNYQFEANYLHVYNLKGRAVPVLVIPKADQLCDPGKHVEQTQVGVANYVEFKFPVAHEELREFVNFMGLSPESGDLCTAGAGYERLPWSLRAVNWLPGIEIQPYEVKNGTHFYKIKIRRDKLEKILQAFETAIEYKKSGKRPPVPTEKILTEVEQMAIQAYSFVDEMDKDDVAYLKEALTEMKAKIAEFETYGKSPVMSVLKWLMIAFAIGGAGAAAITETGRTFVKLAWERIQILRGKLPSYLEDWSKIAKDFPPYDSSVGNREAVIQRIMEKLANPEPNVSRSVMLLADSAQGKTAMMKEIARRIWLWRQYDEAVRAGKAANPPQEYLHPALRGKIFFGINFEAMGSGIELLGQWEFKVASFKRVIKKHTEAIIYGDEFQKALGIGESGGLNKEGKKDLFARVKEDIADGKQIWVVSTTLKEYLQYVVPYDPSMAFLRRFEILTLESYTPDQVKEILKSIGNKLISRNGLVQVDKDGIDALVDALRGQGTPEFLLLNEAKNILIDANNELRRRIREGDESLFEGLKDKDQIKRLLKRREEVAMEIQVLSDLMAPQPVYSKRYWILRLQHLPLVRELKKIDSELSVLTGDEKEKLEEELKGIGTLKERILERLKILPARALKQQAALRLKLRQLIRREAAIEKKLPELPNGEENHIILSRAMLLEEQRKARDVAGKNRDKDLETGARKLRDDIRAELYELKEKYKLELRVEDSVVVPRNAMERESPWLITRRLDRLLREIKTLKGMFAGQSPEPAGLFGGGGKKDMPLKEIEDQRRKVEKMLEVGGHDPELDNLPVEKPLQAFMASLGLDAEALQRIKPANLPDVILLKLRMHGGRYGRYGTLLMELSLLDDVMKNHPSQFPDRREVFLKVLSDRLEASQEHRLAKSAGEIVAGYLHEKSVERGARDRIAEAVRRVDEYVEGAKREERERREREERRKGR